MGNKKISMVVLFFFFSFASSFSCLKISQAVDTLSRCQSINDSEILTSSGGIFYLGFFSPANSRNRYVGIRYKSNFTDGVVWVANRENPIPDSSGTLNFTSNGDLTISQGNQTILSLYSHNSTSNSTLKLLDSGNLVLREGNSDTQVGILWQSFDHPTNTLLPGMTLGFNSKTQKNTSLCSSISAQVLAPGPFSLGVDPNGTKQLVIWERGEVYWISGVWDGKNFSLAPSMLSIYSFDISFVSNEDEHSFTYTVSDDSSGVNAWSMAANFEGQITLTNSRYMSWSPHCKGGAFSTVDYSEGCVRVQQPNCMEGNEFNEFTTKVFFDPLLELEDRSLALTDCENVCKRNCSCTAYSSADPNGTGCSFWHGEEGRPPYNSEHLAYARTVDNINSKSLSL